MMSFRQLERRFFVSASTIKTNYEASRFRDGAPSNHIRHEILVILESNKF
jgi:hypothetical protein